MFEITNLRQNLRKDLGDDSLYKLLIKQNNILQKFNDCIRQGKLQTILYMMSLESDCGDQ